MDPFIGQIVMFAGTFAPRGWALCDGQLLPIAQNTALFSLLGTTYGGDGRTTFGLPPMRGRLPIHEGNGPGLPPKALGELGGNEETTLTVNEMPAHSHTAVVANTLRIGANTGTSDSDDPSDTVVGSGPEIFSETANVDMGAGSIGGTVAVTNSNTGNGVSFTNQMPSLAINYIIALVGTFPS